MLIIWSFFNAYIQNYGYPIGASIPNAPGPISPATSYGYPAYSPNQSDNYKSFFKTVQGVGVIRYGFDYIFNNNMFLGIAIETKFGLNDINANTYKAHPDYKKSKNYFFGLNVELGYVFKKDAAKKKELVEGVEVGIGVEKVWCGRQCPEISGSIL